MVRFQATTTLLVIVSVLVFTAMAASSAPLQSLSLRLPSLTQGGQLGSVTGVVIAAESGSPLATATMEIASTMITIENGEFHIPELAPGFYPIRITGPFRIPLETIVEVRAGENEVRLTVGTTLAQEEIDMLARITRAEAEGESAEGRTAVAASVLNRVLSSRYPSSVSQVVYQRISGRYQYSPVRDGRIRLAPRAIDYDAAYAALAGHDPSGGATGFFNPSKTRDRWVRSQPVTTRIGGHTFFAY